MNYLHHQTHGMDKLLLVVIFFVTFHVQMVGLNRNNTIKYVTNVEGGMSCMQVDSCKKQV